MNRRMQVEDMFDESLLPTEEEVVGYETNGWYISRPVVPHALLDKVRDAIEAHHAGRRDRALPRKARFSDWRPGDGDGVRNNEFCSLQNDGVAALVMYPVIGAIAARLARSPGIRLWDDQAIYKPAAAGDVGRTAVGWHTDHSYWSTCTSKSMLTAWMPLHDAGEQNGTLYVVSGSHLWPESEHLRGFNDKDLDGIEARMGRAVPKALITPMRLKKGQVSFHHMRALHASAPNSASTPRFAVAAHLQDEANRYQPFSTSGGTAIVLPHDELCRRDAEGRPDYADPDVFPQLWPTWGENVKYA
jgi:ectoine hydroxylase-related dioxygenase (phytanoyl-CoA dioxygenase family)